MSIQDKFFAAVNVIKDLPKDGPYQPSTDLMLRFYAYYKQATLGPCASTKPSCWDIKKKLKWDAWMQLGNMSSEEAMQAYISELKIIVETMAFTDSVANFINILDELRGVLNDDEVETPDLYQREALNSYSGELSVTQFMTDDSSPDLYNGPSLCSTSLSAFNQEPSDDEYIDTVETLQTNRSFIINGNTSNVYSVSPGVINRSRDNCQPRNNLRAPFEVASSQTIPAINAEINPETRCVVDVCETLNHTIKCLQADIEKANATAKNLEKALITITDKYERNPPWWPFLGITPPWFILLIVWPFIAQRISNYFILKRRRC